MRYDWPTTLSLLVLIGLCVGIVMAPSAWRLVDRLLDDYAALAYRSPRWGGALMVVLVGSCFGVTALVTELLRWCFS